MVKHQYVSSTVMAYHQQMAKAGLIDPIFEQENCQQVGMKV